MNRTLLIKLSIVVLVLFAACNQNESNNNTSNQNTENASVVPNQNQSQPESQTKSTSNTNTDAEESSAIEAFTYLKKLNISNDVFFKYNESVSEVYNKERGKLSQNDPFYANEGPSIDDLKLVKTKIQSGGKDYYIVFSWGPSADPSFNFYSGENPDNFLFSIAALQLYVPGNGYIYSAGHTNNLFNKRQKFKVSGDKLVEIEQPYYYVGLKSKTKKAIKLYDSENLNRVIAQLPENYSVEVLINKPKTNLLLIKTDFGLTGWLNIENPFRGNETIEGIYYAGD